MAMPLQFEEYPIPHPKISIDIYNYVFDGLDKPIKYL